MNTLRLLTLHTLIMGLPFSAAQAIMISYTHDAAGRLTAVNYNGTSRTAYGYDKNGNLLTRTSTLTPVPKPPPHLAAIYNGLVTHSTTPTADNVGAITLNLLAAGTFTGKVTFRGVGYAFEGSFTATGGTLVPVIVIDRKPPLNDLMLTLTLDVAGGTRQVTGTVSDGVFTSAAVLNAALYNATTNLLPAGLVGKYTALLMPTEATATVPQGDGYVTITMSNIGALVLAGKLANNIAITHSSTLVGAASWPVFIPLHTNAGYIAGHVIFSSNPGVSDFAGTLDWVKPHTPTPLNFHNALFTTKLDFIGSKYDAPLAGQRALDLPGIVPNATFTATHGNLAAPLVRNITLDIANKFITPVDAASLKLTLTATTGLFTGTFKDGTLTRTLGGVLFQEGNFGSGFFPGSTLSGVVEIEYDP